MNNCYDQFKIKPPPNAIFQANSNVSNSNFSKQAPATAHLLSPTVSYGQQMPNALYFSTHVTAVDGTAGYRGVVQPAFTPVNMMDSHPRVPTMPSIPHNFGNQCYRVRQLARFPDAADRVRHCVSTYGTVFHTHSTALPSQAQSAAWSHNVPVFPQVSARQNDNVRSDNAFVPFRWVRWTPPAVQETDLPQIRYTVEIKPEDGETPQNYHLPNNFSSVDSGMSVNGANCKTECDEDQSVPATYLDTPADSSSCCLDADVASVASEVAAVTATTDATNKTGRQKCRQFENYSGINILKLHEKIIKPCSVSLVRLDNTVVERYRHKSNDIVEKFYEADDQELNEPGLDSHQVPVQEKEQELLNIHDTSLFLSTPAVSYEPDEPDVEDGLASQDGDGCSLNEGASAEKSKCYEVITMNSDALLFDMECDDDEDGEALRVILPTENFKTADTSAASSLPENLESERLHRLPTVSHCSAIPIDVDAADSDATTVVEPEQGTSQRLAARACKDKISAMLYMESDDEEDEALRVTSSKCRTSYSAKTASSLLQTMKSKQAQKLSTVSHSDVIPVNVDVNDFDAAVTEPECTIFTMSQYSTVRAYKDETYCTQKQLRTIKINRSENSLIGIPVPLSALVHVEPQSYQEFKLLLLVKTFIPRNILSTLTTLPAYGVHKRRLIQCLFCPYYQFSAKLVIEHVKLQHGKYTPFLMRSLLPNFQTQLCIYCHHCNFITYDIPALLIHFAIYHKVADDFLSSPEVIGNDPTWAPVISPDDVARQFPFYCCPDCGYSDVEWNRIIQHVLQEHSSELVFFGCAVRLIKIGHGGSEYWGSTTYNSFAKEERHATIRTDIYACVSCRCFSSSPTYVFRHYIVHHSCIEMLFMCAASPCCPKRCSTTDDIISHIRTVHVAMGGMQLRCIAALFDRSSLTQLDIGRGEVNDADVPVHANRRSPSSASDLTGLEETVEIVSSDDGE